MAMATKAIGTRYIAAKRGEIRARQRASPAEPGALTLGLVGLRDRDEEGSDDEDDEHPPRRGVATCARGYGRRAPRRWRANGDSRISGGGLCAALGGPAVGRPRAVRATGEAGDDAIRGRLELGRITVPVGDEHRAFEAGDDPPGRITGRSGELERPGSATVLENAPMARR